MNPLNLAKKSFATYLKPLLLTLLAVVLASCSSHKKVPSNNRTDVIEHQILTSHLSKTQKCLLEEARTWLGTPYKYAGIDKGKGTDCSGFVMQAYLTSTKIALPRNSAKQAEYCRRIKAKEVKPGDLVFFATGKDPNRVSHVGIMLDSEDFIHASSSKGVVISSVTNPWYAKRLLMYGRVPKMDALMANN